MERYRRTIGNLTLGVLEGTTEDRPYRVVAYSCKGRPSRILGAFPALAQATAYVDQYRRSFALVG